MLENFQGDSWGSIPPLRMSSLLPHDLCHGRTSSRWLPTVIEFQLSYSRSWKMMLWKVLHSICNLQYALSMQYAGSRQRSLVGFSPWGCKETWLSDFTFSPSRLPCHILLPGCSQHLIHCWTQSLHPGNRGWMDDFSEKSCEPLHSTLNKISYHCWSQLRKLQWWKLYNSQGKLC